MSESEEIVKSPEHQQSVRTIQDSIKDLNITVAENTFNILIELLTTLTKRGTEPLLDKLIGIVGPTPESTQKKIQLLRELVNDEDTKIALRQFQTDVVNIIVDLLDEAMEKLEPLIDMVGDRLGNSLRRVLGQVARIVTEIIDTLVSPIPPLAIFINVTQLIAAVTGIFKIYFTQTLPTVLEAVNTTLELWTGSQLKALLLKGQVLKLYNIFVGQVDKLSSVISNVQEAAGTNANALLDKTLDTATGATSAVGNMASSASDAANQAVESATEKAEGVQDAVETTAEAVESATEEAAESVVADGQETTEESQPTAESDKLPQYPMPETGEDVKPEEVKEPTKDDKKKDDAKKDDKKKKEKDDKKSKPKKK